MFETLKSAFRVKEMRRKLLYLLAMIFVIRIGSQLPIPGVDGSVFKQWFKSNTGDAFNFFDAFTGGSFESMSVFALNITPYITSSIIIQLLTIAIPALEEMHRDGEEGRKKMTAITRYVTVGLALFESIAMTIGFSRGNIVKDMNFLKAVVVIASLTAGSAMLMWIGERITEKGVGNGISIVLAVNIVSRIPSDMTTLYENFNKRKTIAKGMLAGVIIFAIIIIVPVIYCFNVSMMDLKEIYGGKFLQSHLTIEIYTRAFQLAPFFTFIKNSLIVSGVITFAQVVTGALAAYAFAMMEFKGKKVLFYIMLATMMIPSQAIIIANYLTIADWGIRNTYAALILPNAAAAFAVFNMRQAFLTLPKEIHEAAEIDGCTQARFFFQIALPLSKAIIAILVLYYGVGHWNSYFSALVYISDKAKYPLQLVLRNILITNQTALSQTATTAAARAALQEKQQLIDVMKYSLIIISSIPVLVMYPLVQKHFVKGVMIGSMKG